MNLASGMIAMAARKNTDVEGSPSFDPAIAIGVKARRRRKNVCMRAGVSTVEIVRIDHYDRLSAGAEGFVILAQERVWL
jgi:hypothetical protein